MCVCIDELLPLGRQRGVIRERAESLLAGVGASQDVFDAAAGVDLVAKQQRARRRAVPLGLLGVGIITSC